MALPQSYAPVSQANDVYNAPTVTTSRPNQTVLATSARIINIIGGSVNIATTGISLNWQILVLCTGGVTATVVADGGATQIGGSNAPQTVKPGTFLSLIWNGTGFNLQ